MEISHFDTSYKQWYNNTLRHSKFYTKYYSYVIIILVPFFISNKNFCFFDSYTVSLKHSLSGDVSEVRIMMFLRFGVLDTVDYHKSLYLQF